MLSPTVSINSNGNVVRVFAITAPSSICSFLPVPKSPMTPNFKDPSLFGRATCGAAAGGFAWIAAGPRAAAADTQAAANTHSTSDNGGRGAVTISGCRELLRDGVVHVVDDHLGVHVEQDQALGDEVVLHVARQLRQLGE